jgi:hypothetical protein
MIRIFLIWILLVVLVMVLVKQWIVRWWSWAAVRYAPNPIPESDLTGFDKSWIWIWLNLTRIGFGFDWIWLRFVLNYTLSPSFLLYENTPRSVLSILWKHPSVLISYIMKVPLATHSLLYEGILRSSLSVIYFNQI